MQLDDRVNIMSIKTIFILTLILLAGCVERGGIIKQSEYSECSDVERWATSMAFVNLKNAGITSNESLDFNKTKTTRLASENIGDNLYTQIHCFHRKIRQKNISDY